MKADSLSPVFLRHREKVLAHAEGRLASQGRRDPKDRLLLYRKFLKIENHRLRLKHNAGGGGREIAQQRATLVDIVLRHLYEPLMEPDSVGLSLVAIGGYGRGELNPLSDVDIMFLHEGPSRLLDTRIKEVVQSVLYMLWDIGFKVGHSTRSIPGAVKQANADMLSKTSLLESRLVCGDPVLFSAFQDTFQARCVDGRQEEYIKDRIRNQAERHAKYGGTVYLQEPNIKNACGGLRDYQNLLWMSYFKEGISSTSELVERKFLNETERRELDRAYDFLLRVRTELHYLHERPNDVLSLNYQMQVANKFEYPQKNLLRRSEAFMRDYYTHARNIYRITDLLCERLALTESQPLAPRLLRFLTVKPQRKESFDGFHSIDGKIYADSQNVFRDDPYRMMRLFQHAQQRHMELSPELKQLIRRRLRIVDKTFQYSRAARMTFEAILSRKGEVGRILRMMHEVDFLGRYIPEFGQLTCLVQHEFFHRYTADEHTLVCIDKLDDLIDTEDPKVRRYRQLFQSIEDPYVLYLALLLHDVGKAANAKHHAEASALFAQRVARRLQLTSDQRRSVISLVDNHLTLSQTAQRRNLDDIATIEEFVITVKNQADLDRLMLLTLADGRGTGDEKWSDWKESLVWTLYQNASQYFADSAEFFRQRKIERDALHKEVSKKLAKDYADEIEAHFDGMPDSYFRTNETSQIVSHIRLFRRFIEARFEDPGLALAPAVKWIEHPEMGHSEVWICTWNRSELLAKIAGSFAAAQVNILSADIFTRTDDLVLDIFRVCDTNFQAVTGEKEVRKVDEHLRASLSEEKYDFGPLITKSKKRRGYHLSQELDFPTRIMVANDSNPTFTIVEIQTPDRLGLLYNVLKAFSKLKIDISISRVATEKGAAIDSFYVTDQDRRKITDPDEIARLQRALHRAVTVQMRPER